MHVLNKYSLSYYTDGAQPGPQVNGHLNGLGDKLNASPFGPAFPEFIYKTIMPACFYGPVRQTDGDPSQLISECLACLKSIQRVRGNEEFCTYLQNHFFTEHFPTYQNRNELIQSFANNEAKTLKNRFREFVDEAKKAQKTS